MSDERRKKENTTEELGEIFDDLAEFAVDALTSTTQCVGDCASGICEAAGEILSGIGDGL